MNKRIKTLIIISFLFNIGLMVTLRIVSDFFNNHDFISKILDYWAWVYCGGFLFLMYILFFKYLLKTDIDLTRLFIIKIILALVLFVVVGKLHLNPFWNFQKYFYQYSLIDDEEYYEDPYADSDPLYGHDGSGYSSNFKYFTELKTNLDGLRIPKGIITKDDNLKYYLDNNGELNSVNISNSIFWQYALIKGYSSLDKNKKISHDFIGKLFKIGPFYLLELIIVNIGQSILFAIIVLLIFFKWPHYIFKEV
jgi:hypothetical protein